MSRCSVRLVACGAASFLQNVSESTASRIGFLCDTGKVSVLLPVAMKDARRDEEDRIFDSVSQRFGVIHDYAMR